MTASDLAKFGSFFQSPPKPYGPCADYRPVFGEIHAGDFAHFAVHYKHNAGAAAASAENLIMSDATLRVDLDESDRQAGGHRLWATLSVDKIEPFKALVISLRSGSPRLRFVAWHPNAEYPATSMGAEITRAGQKQVFIGVIGTRKQVPATAQLGRVELEVLGDGPLSLTNEDLEFLIADLLAVDGGLRGFSSLRVERQDTPPPYRFELAQNVPNPFNPSTTIAYSLARDSEVSLAVFDVRGARVKTLVGTREQAGMHHVSWDGTDERGMQVSSGIYFYRLIAGSFTDTKKMALLR